MTTVVPNPSQTTEKCAEHFYFSLAEQNEKSGEYFSCIVLEPEIKLWDFLWAVFLDLLPFLAFPCSPSNLKRFQDALCCPRNCAKWLCNGVHATAKGKMDTNRKQLKWQKHMDNERLTNSP